MIIVAVPNPTGWWRWKEAEALLEPARRLGGFETCIDPDEALWCVFGDKGALLACATAWLSSDKYVEVKLVGGRDRKTWLKALDDKIGSAARGAGATRLIAMGRRGWLRELSALGWESTGETDGMTIYSRELGE